MVLCRILKSDKNDLIYRFKTTLLTVYSFDFTTFKLSTYLESVI